MLSAHKGFTCQHRSDDFPIIVEILRLHRPMLAVELGTDRGGFASLLADTLASWGGHVVTLAKVPKFDRALLTAFPNLTFAQASVQPKRSNGVVSLLDRPFTLLYCDDGNKMREMELYAPTLWLGSLLGVHDYGSEVDSAWAESFVAGLGYEPEGHARMETLRNEWYPEPMTRFWVRRRSPACDFDPSTRDVPLPAPPDIERPEPTR